MITFLISYIFLLWFRWTATSGILEFAVFAYVMKNVQYSLGGVILLLTFSLLFIELFRRIWVRGAIKIINHNNLLLKGGLL